MRVDARRGLAVVSAGVLLGALGVHSMSAAGTGGIELELEAARKQGLRNLNVKASCIDATCRVRITGKVYAFRLGDERTFKIKPRTRTVGRGAIRNIQLRVKGDAAREQIQEMLRRGGEAEARIRGFARADDGSSDRDPLDVKLIRPAGRVAASVTRAYPGINGSIAFERTDSGSGANDIFAMGPNGGNPTNLTPWTPADVFEPSYSADGAWIAFQVGQGAESDIYVMSAFGLNPVNLTPGPGVADTSPAFSPDGTRIVFQSDRDSGFPDIFVMGADGSNPTNLTPTPIDSAEFDPQFSPNGTQIAFASTRDGGDTAIFVMGADGSNPTNLTPALAGGETAPSFSPNGNRIAFMKTTTALDIYVMGADGSNPTNLTPNTPFVDANPAFSPDGRKIAFETTRGIPGARLGVDGAGRGVFARNIFVMGADGSEPTNLTKSSTVASSHPTWQPIPRELVPNCAGRDATIVGTAADDVLRGGPDADVIVGLGGDDVLVGGGSKDRLCGGDGRDRLTGGERPDRLRGQNGKDTLRGGAGGDRLNGGKGGDACRGGPGPDRESKCEV